MTSPDFDFPGRLPANARYVGPVLDDPTWSGTGVDAAARRRAARARRPVVDVPGPRGDRATDRRRPGDVARAGRRHHRPGPRPGVDHRRGERHRGRRRAAPRGARPRPRRSSPTAATARSSRPSPPASRSSCCRTAGTRPTTRCQGRRARRRRDAEADGEAGGHRRAVRTVVDDPGYRVAAERLGASIRRDAAGSALVDELEDVCRRRSAAPGRRRQPAALRACHQRHARVTSTAPMNDPISPLGLRARPSPASRLASRPPTNEPMRPAPRAIPQSMPRAAAAEHELGERADGHAEQDDAEDQHARHDTPSALLSFGICLIGPIPKDRTAPSLLA